MKTVILGLDAFDPGIFERLLNEGRLPHLTKYVLANQYAHFSVSNPPQSEVSWTSIATGADPGVHGMFDFVHRDPGSYALIPSLLLTKSDRLGTQFIPAHTTRTLFEQATLKGYPATVLWWPATFPARLELPVKTLPGLGTPDIQGRLGVGAAFSLDRSMADAKFKTPVELLQKKGAGSYWGRLKGPARKTSTGSQETILEFQLLVNSSGGGRLIFGKHAVDLTLGQWSSIFEVTFNVGFLVSIRAITRAILTQGDPEPQLYFLPLQIHPLHAPYRYATPPGFVRETWNGYGPFLTLGWPQDTTGLEEGWINDEQFINLCRSIDQTREQIFFHHLHKFREGVLANVFDTLDRIQHMYLHRRPELVESWYMHLDELVGAVQDGLNKKGKEDTRLLILSDHGFSRFDTKVHLNRWLIENNYLKLQIGQPGMDLRQADWQRSQAYAIGLNSVYLNLQGREGQGIVGPGEVEKLRQGIRQNLLDWRGPDGSPVVQQVYFREQAFSGPLLAYGPDLVVGYAPGYRASAQTGLGKWEDVSLESNRDHWRSDHCIDPHAVPGVIFANTGLSNLEHPSFRDIPFLATGMTLEHGDQATRLPPTSSAEDEKTIEERLKGLGYL